MKGLFQCPPRARSFWAFSPFLNHMRKFSRIIKVYMTVNQCANPHDAAKRCVWVDNDFGTSSLLCRMDSQLADMETVGCSR